MKAEEDSQRKILILAGILMVALLILLLRMWYVQIYKGAGYKARIKGHSQLTVRLPAVRGEICDRHGVPLVENRASMEVEFYLPDIVRAWKEEHGSIPKLKYWGLDHGMRALKEQPDIVKIVNESIVPRLEKLGLAGDYNSRKLQLHFRDNAEVPYVYRQDLDFETMARFSENNLDLPGVTVTLKPVRHYVYGALAAHLFGYVGVPKEIDKEEASLFNFYQPDIEGKAQVEEAYNDVLKGTAGTRFLQRNAHGVIDGETSRIEPKQGSKVYLTIDAGIQYIVEKALRVVGRGAAVVLDPNTGEILAMASVPSFDPNQFVPSISRADWEKLSKDQTDPLMNRAINAYAPGSTFKLCTALAGIRAGISNKEFDCSGGVQYGDKYMKCWVLTAKPQMPPHGHQDLSTAIKNSCNAYFFQYGNAAGIDQIDAVGGMLGLGQKSELPLNNVASGVLPGSEWLSQNYPRERWSPGYTANTSIGQGFVLATPLQMAVIAATVANGGSVYQPHLVDKVVAQDGTVLKEEPIKIRSDLIKEGGILPDQFEKVRKGMWKVVNDDTGTARKARVKDSVVAGKTGTAQFFRNGVKDYHTWFLCFAPYDKPRYVVAVFVQGGKSGGSVPAPIAAKILEQIFAMEKGQEVKLEALAPALGNFQPIAGIDFSKQFPSQYGSDTEPVQDAPAESPELTRQSGGASGAKPDIKEEADAQGRANNKPRPQGGLQKFFNFLGGGRSAASKQSN
ncbi:MAG: penicillin-binding protein 2 [Verrucomicrobia bacterium]|nr:penicillin-binding protein 2 [Verrucomicrobiota bacterium]